LQKPVEPEVIWDVLDRYVAGLNRSYPR
jgi:hypothetical protein